MVLQTNADLRLIDSNPATRATTGYAIAELTDPGFWERFLGLEQWARFRVVLDGSLAGQAGRTELVYRARDYSERFAFALTQPLDAGGIIAGVTILLVDVTRERRLEMDLQRAQRLEVIGRLSSGIAHDFNNLLTVVMGMASLVRGSLPAGHPAHQDLRRITEACEQAANLAGQLLAFSRNRRTNIRPVEVRQVVRRTLELLRPTLPGAIELKEQLGENDLFIQADETQLQQVLMNLFLNARDALGGKGQIRVQAEAVLEQDEGDKLKDVSKPSDSSFILHPSSFRRWVRLSVDDTGHGINEQVRPKIFDPFFSTKEHGTGLGLAVVQQIVESYGGRVEVASQPGRGSRFDVWLPLSAEGKETGSKGGKEAG
jgi:signal transduction histidine kinase